jgi:hypothetical protein
VGDDLQGLAAEKGNKVVDYPVQRGTAGHHGFENMRVADFARAPDGFFEFEAINDGLDGRVGRPFRRGKRLLELADGAGALGPEGFHDAELKSGQLWFRLRHLGLYYYIIL